jgi:hypothetical protein
MADIATIMERLAAEIRKEDDGERTKAQEERIAALEAQLEGAKPTQREVREAIEDISEEEWVLIREHRAAAATPLAADPPAADPPAADPPQRKTRPGRKKGNAYQWSVDDKGNVVKTDIAHIDSGENKPDEVEIIPAADAAAA